MKEHLRILHLEDEPDYSHFVRELLARDGLQVEVVLVDTIPAFRRELEKGPYDLVLADYSLPTCTGVDALQIARQKCPDTPFLLVSGAVGEQAAIDSLRQGATDYVLKQWPDRLLPAVQRALKESRERKERKQAETRLRLQSAALESAANAILITDRQGAVVWSNTAFSQLTGYSREEILGQNPRFLKSGEHPASFYQQLWAEVLAGRVWRAEMVNRRKDGSLYTEEATITPVMSDRGEVTHFIAVKQDITARKQLEAQLRQSQKMEGIGQLAGGVAHDFNNLLLVIAGNAELALMNEDQLGEEVRKCLTQITAASKRAGNLIRQLLAFSRKQAIQPRKLLLNDVIGELTKMLKRIIGENILLQTRLAADLPYVQADAGMMDQVVVNLVVNARDAMPQGGRLEITTDRATIDEAYCQAHSEARAGEFVRLTVSDSGSGIAAENLPRIFEPFFTTKEAGKGTGLGLATVYGIVKQHQGWIDVFSEVGKGSRFDIYLPLVDPPEVQSAPHQSVPKASGAKARILLVEDDFAVRLTTRRILEAFGYEVREADNGQEALELWRQNRSEIDLLLTDIVMPEGLSGLELAKKMRAESPRLKILFTTGYSDTAGQDTEFFRRNRDSFLHKPYRKEDLLEKLKQCLTES